MQELEALLLQPSYQRVESPPWDRTVDIVCHRHEHGERIPPVSLDAVLDAATLEVIFPEYLNVKRIQTKKKKGYHDLPPSVRRRIWGYVIKPHATPVTLSRLAFTRQAWSLDSLTTFSKAYGEIKKYINIAPLVRIDVLLTFLSVNTFHVTLSPHVGPRISPLATKWLVKYGAWMEKIILEVDMTKLGLGGTDGADMLYPGLRNVQELVKDFAKSQGERKVPLKELTLLCRRYYGEREHNQSETMSTRSSYNSSGSYDSSLTSSYQLEYQTVTRVDSPIPAPLFHRNNGVSDSSSSSYAYSGDTVPNSRTPSPLKSPSTPKSKLYYCPNYHLPLLNPLYKPLHTKIYSLRMCGFSEKYSHAFIKAIFPASNGRCVFRLGPSNGAWPRLVGQRSWIDDGRGEHILDVVEEDDDVSGFVWLGSKMPPRPVRSEDGGLSLPRAILYRKGEDQSAKSEKTISSGSSGKTMSRGKRFKKFLAGAGGKAESIRDSGSSKGSKENKAALMSELPGYI